MTDVFTLLINKDDVDLNVPNNVCLDLSWRRPHDFLLLLCLSVSVSVGWRYTSPCGIQEQDDRCGHSSD
jgi:hypothetical protein